MCPASSRRTCGSAFLCSITQRELLHKEASLGDSKEGGEEEVQCGERDAGGGYGGYVWTEWTEQDGGRWQKFRLVVALPPWLKSWDRGAPHSAVTPPSLPLMQSHNTEDQAECQVPLWVFAPRWHTSFTSKTSFEGQLKHAIPPVMAVYSWHFWVINVEV